MGVSYFIVNTTKKQYFRPGDLLSSDRFSGLLNGLSGHALALLIQDQSPGKSNRLDGLWAGDALYAVGDSSFKSAVHSGSTSSAGTEAWEILRKEYADITPAMVARLCAIGHVEDFLAAAEKHDYLFAKLANLMEQHESPAFSYAFIQRFGKDWRRRFNQIVARAASNNFPIQYWDLQPILGLVASVVTKAQSS